MFLELLREIRIWIIQLEASLVLRKYKPQVIAITGSVGKTSAKDAIYTALKDVLDVRKSPKSLNGELGTPLAILGGTSDNNTIGEWLNNFWKGITLLMFRKEYPKYLVLEVGLGRPNEISRIARWLKPHIALVTRLSKTPVHVEFFKSVADLHNEKGALVDALRPDGTFIYNSDDEDVVAFQKRTTAKKTSFGENIHADVKAHDYAVMYDVHGKPTGVRFSITVDGKSYPIEVAGSLGRQHMLPIMTAVSVGAALGINTEKVIASLRHHNTPSGRMRIIQGLHESTIIDDTYNASPIATEEALKTLADITNSGRKSFAIGDMKELGPHSEKAHRAIGKLAASTCTILICVGEQSKFISDEAIVHSFDKNNSHLFSNSSDAAVYLHSILNKNDIVLVKGSQSMRMEKIVEAVMKNPADKSKLLVRQDGFWRNK